MDTCLSTEKVCRKCKQAKPLDQFYARKTAFDGRRGECIECGKAEVIAAYHKDPEKSRVKSLARYYKTGKIWVSENRNRVKMNWDCWIQKNYGSEAEYMRQRRPQIREWERGYKKKKYHSDPIFKLKVWARNAVNKILRPGTKFGRSLEYLGCSPEEYKQHLESKFLFGMTWDNHGTVWHIDHIRPIASFDLSKESDIRTCCHFSNHQPLFAKDNLQKADSWPI